MFEVASRFRGLRDLESRVCEPQVKLSPLGAASGSGSQDGLSGLPAEAYSLGYQDCLQKFRVKGIRIACRSLGLRVSGLPA